MDDNRMALLRTTVESEGDAKALAKALVQGRLAACVHLQRIESFYCWEGEIQEDLEWLVEARVPAGQVDGAWEHVLSNHPYDLPMVEVIPETRVTAKYAAWAADVTGTTSASA